MAATKIMSSAEAVRRFIGDGAQITLGGFTIARNAMVIIHELIRQRRRNLHLVCHSNGQGLDLLIGAGCVAKLEIAYSGNGRFAPTCIRFRLAAERGEIALEDYSNFQMSLRFLAGSLGIPFIPAKSGLGTDILQKEGFSPELRKARKTAPKKTILLQNPFADQADPVVLLPALNPDVALIHCQQAGDDGTVRIRGLSFADIELAKAADAVIVSCEEVVPAASLRAEPERNAIPPFLVDAVVPAPFGAHPTACPYCYDYDAAHLNLYKGMAKDDGLFRQYLDDWVYGVPDHAAYLKKVGREGLAAIRTDGVSLYKKGLKRS
ncbi:MAG: CoA transferase subunit A [Deltaproteobacteria bacterium]|nr:CoA transferase subunit A [Deltaproteobacteria bacterium]